MTLGLAFWIVFLVWLVFGAWIKWPNIKAEGIKASGELLLFILLLLLGWAVFGAPIHG